MNDELVFLVRQDVLGGRKVCPSPGADVNLGMMESLKFLCSGLPLDPLPPRRPRDPSVPHAPVRHPNLSLEEKKASIAKILNEEICIDST